VQRRAIPEAAPTVGAVTMPVRGVVISAGRGLAHRHSLSLLHPLLGVQAHRVPAPLLLAAVASC